MENLTEVQIGYDDIRFGKVDIYVEKETQNLIMVKTKKSETFEEHEYSQRLAEERYSIRHPNILKMTNFLSFEDKLEIKMMYEYPNEDLYEKKEDLKNIKEFLKFFKDILQALRELEKEKMIHGNIKPEFIYYDKKTDNYILLDRLADSSSPNQAQMNNLKNRENLYVSPIVFEYLMQNNLKIPHNPFKSEIFGFGMICLAMLLDNEDQLQGVYNFEEKCFDTEFFFQIVNFVKDKYFSEGDSEILGDFLFFCILNLNSKERISPRKAFVILERTINTFQEELKSLRYISPQVTSMADNFHNDSSVHTPLTNQLDIDSSIFEEKNENHFFDNSEIHNHKHLKHNEEEKIENDQIEDMSKNENIDNEYFEREKNNSIMIFGKKIETDGESLVSNKNKIKPKESDVELSDPINRDLEKLKNKKSFLFENPESSENIFLSEENNPLNFSEKINNNFHNNEISEQSFKPSSQNSKREIIKKSIEFDVTEHNKSDLSQNIDYNYSKITSELNEDISPIKITKRDEKIFEIKKRNTFFQSDVDEFYSKSNMENVVVNKTYGKKLSIDHSNIKNESDEKFFESGKLEYNQNVFEEVNFFGNNIIDQQNYENQIKQEELLQMQKEEEKKRQEELQMQKEEEKKRQEELQMQKEEEEEKIRQELQLQMQKEEEEKIKQQALLRIQKQEEERKRQEELQLQMQKEKDEKEKEKKRKEELLRIQKQEEERKRQEELQLQMQKEKEEKEKKIQEELILEMQKEEERKRQQELQLKMQKEEEEKEKKRQEELQMQIKKEVERKKQQELLQIQKEEEEKIRQEELLMQIQKEEEEKEKKIQQELQLKMQIQKEEEIRKQDLLKKMEEKETFEKMKADEEKLKKLEDEEKKVILDINKKQENKFKNVEKVLENSVLADINKKTIKTFAEQKNEEITKNFTITQKINIEERKIEDKQIQVEPKIIITPSIDQNKNMGYLTQNFPDDNKYHSIFTNNIQHKKIEKISYNDDLNKIENNTSGELNLLLSKDRIDSKDKNNNCKKINENEKNLRNFGSKSPIRIKRITKEEYEECLKKSKSPNIYRPNVYQGTNIHFSKVQENVQISETTIKKPDQQIYTTPVNMKNIDYFNHQNLKISREISPTVLPRNYINPQTLPPKKDILLQTGNLSTENKFLENINVPNFSKKNDNIIRPTNNQIINNDLIKTNNLNQTSNIYPQINLNHNFQFQKRENDLNQNLNQEREKITYNFTKKNNFNKIIIQSPHEIKKSFSPVISSPNTNNKEIKKISFPNRNVSPFSNIKQDNQSNTIPNSQKINYSNYINNQQNSITSTQSINYVNQPDKFTTFSNNNIMFLENNNRNTSSHIVNLENLKNSTPNNNVIYKDNIPYLNSNNVIFTENHNRNNPNFNNSYYEKNPSFNNRMENNYNLHANDEKNNNQTIRLETDRSRSPLLFKYPRNVQDVSPNNLKVGYNTIRSPLNIRIQKKTTNNNESFNQSVFTSNLNESRYSLYNENKKSKVYK